MLNLEELSTLFDTLALEIELMTYDTAFKIHSGYNEYDDGDSIQFDFMLCNCIFTVRKYHSEEQLFLCNDFNILHNGLEIEVCRC